GVSIAGQRLAPGQQVGAPIAQVVLNFSERLSTSGGAAGAHSVNNLSNWRLTKDGADVSGSVRSVSFGFNANTGKYEAIVSFPPSAAGGNYTLVATSSIRDVAGN